LTEKTQSIYVGVTLSQDMIRLEASQARSDIVAERKEIRISHQVAAREQLRSYQS